MNCYNGNQAVVYTHKYRLLFSLSSFCFLTHVNTQTNTRTHALYTTTKTQFMLIDSSKGNHTLLLAHYTQKEPACSLTTSLHLQAEPFTSQQTGHMHINTKHTHATKQQHGCSAGFRGQLKSSIRLILVFPEMSVLQMAWLALCV